VGVHHAGLMPILREMTELLFARGFIKILFCTETMSVGINLPVKTTIFTDINKFNGEIVRTLHGHEYTQAAGRAGRLGLDTVGHVIHLNNLFRNVDPVSYKTMMNGKPQVLTSKFKISYNLLLNLLDIGDQNLTQFASRSMITCDLDDQMKQINYKMTSLQTELDNVNNSIKLLRTPMEVLDEYLELKKSVQTVFNKKRKEIERKIQHIIDNHRFLNQDLQSYQKISIKEKEMNELKCQYDSLQGYLQSGVDNVLQLLSEEKYIEEPLKLTLQGKIASQIREIHCLIFSKLYDLKKLDELSSKQLVALFSCFTNIRVLEDFKDNVPKSTDKLINDKVKEVLELYNDYQKKELERNINTGFDYNIHYDLLNYVEEWCNCENVEDCKQILQKMAGDKEIFLGEFVKALLKINNISCEFEKIAEMTGNIAFLSKLREIPKMTLKYVVTNQSLYV
jgi:superfamily II RNA helicase